MSVVLILEMHRMTPEIYDAINDRIGFPGTVPEGLLTHIAAVEEDGMRFVDIWESEPHFERFLEGKLLPAMAEVADDGMVSPPRVAQLSLHDYWIS